MKALTREVTLRKLRTIFEDSSSVIVYDWFAATNRTAPVVIVGSGFTRNAQRADGARVTSREAPLWADLTRAVCDEMGILSPAAYDAPTLMELYHEHVGKHQFVHRMRDILQDDDLLPGEAHSALANYPLEAIITTNLLDTLLDKTKGPWVRVVEDTDLALNNRHPKTLRQLIYFHGHRDNSATWVLTRSEYEDVPRTRPLIVNKIRQLLVQHPLLILGYSLSDPDFHHIYRTVSRAMGGAQPKGIAVMVNPPIEAERRHWENLGIYCVILREGRRLDVGASIREFLEISPNQRLPFIELSRYVEGAPSETSSAPLTSKIARLNQIFAAESQAYIQDLSSDDLESCWMACAESVLPATLREKIEFTVSYGDRRIDVPGAKDSTTRQSPASIYVPQKAALSNLGLNRIQVLLVTDALLSESLARNDEVVEWLQAWIRFASSPHRATTHRFEHAVRICHALLQSLPAQEYARQMTECEEVSRRFAIGPFGAHGATPAGGSSEWHTKMREALESVRANDLVKAKSLYLTAMQMAKNDRHLFREWLAVVGASDCEDKDEGERGSLKDDRLRLERMPDVEEWNSSVKQALTRLAENVMPVYDPEDCWIVHASDSLGEFPYGTCTKLLRDLEHHYAPLSLQRKMASPLIVRGAYRSCPVREFQRRLDFNVSETDRWLQKYCVSRLQLQVKDCSSRIDLDMAMWSVFADFKETDFYAVDARWSVVSSIWPIMPKGSEAVLRKLIASMRSMAKDRRFARRGFQAWVLLLILAGPTGLAEFESFLADPQIDWPGRVFAGLDEIPWSMWVRQGKMSAQDAAVRLLSVSSRMAALDDRLGLGARQRIWSLVELVMDGGLKPEECERLYGDALVPFVDSTLARQIDIEEARALGWLLSLCDKEKYRRLLERVEGANVDLGAEKSWNEAFEYLILLSECSVRGEHLSDTLVERVKPWLVVESRWESLVQRIVLHHPESALSLALARLARSEVFAEIAQSRLRQLVVRSADFLPGSLSASDQLDPQILTRLRACVFGTSRERRVVFETLVDGIAGRKEPEKQQDFLNDVDGILNMLPGFSLSDSPRAVRGLTQFVGSALVCQLSRSGSTLDRRLCVTMENIVQDENPLIRQFAAHAAGRLKRAAEGTCHESQIQGWAARFEAQPFAAVAISLAGGASQQG